jgi:hypothetical protein
MPLLLQLVIPQEYRERRDLFAVLKRSVAFAGSGISGSALNNA